MMSIVLRLARRRGGRGQRLDVHRSGGFVPTARHNDAVSTGDRTTLVGRDRAMAVAGASLEAALAGLPRLVLIGGEPGIRKTAMARELARRAQERGAQLGWGAGWEGAGAQPYWPWSRALRPVGGAELVSDPAAGTAAPGADLVGLRFRMYASVSNALRTAGPIVLVLDDLHWFDAESVRLLDFASRQPDLGPVLLVGTYRDVDITENHPLQTVLGNLPSEAVL